MNNALFAKSQREHFYYFDINLHIINLSNPLLYKLICGKERSDFSEKNSYLFYNKKYKYLFKHGFFDRFEKTSSPVSFQIITPEMIKDSIVNSRQIVFEVTDACNLKCKYCGYGEFYQDYDKRENKELSLEFALTFLRQIKKIWDSNSSRSFSKDYYIGFYGGEPLLNMKFIKKIVKVINSWNDSGQLFHFSMTTNAMLLDRHIDYLVENEFDILVSLDGNEYGHSYRVDKAGKSSFLKIIKNLDIIKDRYPEYFDKHINFNAVLHNRNSVSEIYQFIKEQYDKVPTISELNNMGIKYQKVGEFSLMYKNIRENLNQLEYYLEIPKDLLARMPNYQEVAQFLINYLGSYFDNYNSLLYPRRRSNCIPTGTCIPFSKKIFITVNGKILPCERIGHQFCLGQITNNGVDLDYESISKTYNNYFSKLTKYCTKCYRYGSCIQCVFNIHQINGSTPVCPGYTDEKKFIQYVSNNISFLEENADEYFKIAEEAAFF